jgi:hypothetical protein
MTPNVSNAWRAQSPRADFAERTVAAILRDRIERRRTARRPRWTSVIVVATVMVGAGALAWAALPKTPRTEVSRPDVAPRTIDVAKKSPAGAQVSPTPEPSIERPRPSSAAPATSPPRRKDAVIPDRVRKVNLPRCNCVQTICDCVEEQ